MTGFLPSFADAAGRYWATEGQLPPSGPDSGVASTERRIAEPGGCGCAPVAIEDADEY